MKKSERGKHTEKERQDFEEIGGIHILETEESGPCRDAVTNRGDLLWEADMNDLSLFDLYTGPAEGVWSAADDTIRIDGGHGNKAISKVQGFDDIDKYCKKDT